MQKQRKKKRRKPFSHLNQTKRDRLEALLDTGVKQYEIAKILKVNKSTISREIQRRKRENGRYNADRAENKAKMKRGNSKYQGMKIEVYPELRKYITEGLKKKRSPDEISGRMKREKITPRIGTASIYKWLYSRFGQRYCKYLCTKRYKPKKWKKKTERVMIPHRINVKKRPKIKGLIHAEGDLFVSPTKSKSQVSGAIVVVPKTKLVRLKKIKNKRPVVMKQAVKYIRQDIVFDTLTLDNGIENKQHEQFGVPTYFCDPHAPWQKPHVESTIGLIRRWELPKGTDLSKVSPYRFKKIEKFLNNKYRKSLGYMSANERSTLCGIIKNN